MADITPGALGTLQGIVVSAGVILALFIGFCVILTFPKQRASGLHTRTLRGLDELVGGRAAFLPPDAPRGQVDQLRTPELLETRGRNSA